MYVICVVQDCPEILNSHGSIEFQNNVVRSSMNVCPSVTHKFPILSFVFLISFKIKVIELCVIKDISMLKMFTFNVFSVCHLFGQSVTGLAFFIFWLKVVKKIVS